ncbi:membrane-bound glycerophospholipid O-acyltransferase 1-like [Petromyzon marinus]|uniref:membrane-bound glycerophospholipid O-acyltransferase 1-like n=1 Tax=Petromyzon marinus TaxID=7757 RepID=UPI003F70D5C3
MDAPLPTTGSTVLLPLSNKLNMPIDQVNFVMCQLLALAMAFFFRLYLHPRAASERVRHGLATLLGSYFAIFCFGWYATHFFVQVIASYAIIVLVDTRNVHKYTFIFAMGYLTVCQISRVYIFTSGVFSTDFSGPMMVMTQKITSLAFEIHDGMIKEDQDLTVEQRRLASRRLPTLLQFLSFNLNFLSILAGPSSSFKDYTAFIEGSHYKGWERSGACGRENGPLHEPSPAAAVTSKLLMVLLSLVFYLTLSKAFPVSLNADEAFIASAPLHARLCYLYVSCQGGRPKYYFAWTLADAINNAAGFGFNGYDKNGRSKWDLVSNLNIWNIETATSFKMFIDNWNIQTALWLKRVCYERAAQHRTVATFVLSAVWHGVYPGYYFTFLTGIPMTMAARAVRNNFRHLFLGSRGLKVAYDVVTWASTQMGIAYTVAPFVLLATEPTLRFYSSMYFHFHLLSLMAVLLLPSRRSSPRGSAGSENDVTPHQKPLNNNCSNGCNFGVPPASRLPVPPPPRAKIE